MKRLLLTTLLLLFSPLSMATQQVTFGIVPQQSAATLAKKWGPILKYLSNQTGYNFVFRTAKDIPEFEKRVLNGEYDVAYMNPYHYTVFHQKPGYNAFAKQKDKKIRGILVVRNDSEITELSQLQETTLAFPSPAAFAASVIPRSSLTLQDISFEPKYVSSHDSVYLNVSKSLFTAGGGIERTFNNTTPAVREQLRILWKTPGYTPHAFATHPDMSKDMVNAISQALLSLNDNEKGQALLSSISFKGVEVANNADWDDVRALKITLLDHLLEN